MPKRLGKFELPSKLTKVEEGATPTYAKFIAEPFEAGYGHTVGNSLRRVLLSSIEGSAISSIKIDGVNHEFQSVDGVVEDRMGEPRRPLGEQRGIALEVLDDFFRDLAGRVVGDHERLTDQDVELDQVERASLGRFHAVDDDVEVVAVVLELG